MIETASGTFARVAGLVACALIAGVLVSARGGALHADPAEAAPLPRVTLGADGAETVHGELRLRAGRIYELRNDLFVQDGKLVIEPGTRVEADPGTSIVISRAGRIIADGTLSLPIVLTCAGAAAPGCWNGIAINGFGHVNGGMPTSPVVAGRDAIGGCLELSVAGELWGGCQDNDSSGVFRHVWIENAGAPDRGALALRGVGSRTVVENVQVLRSAGAGIEISGGKVRLRYARVIAANETGLAWRDGWRGLAQYGIIQAKAGAQSSIDGGSNASSPDAAPRSAPVLRNFTIIGPPEVVNGSGAASVHLHTGTAATLQAFAVANQPALGAWLLDIDDDATWTRWLQGEVRFEHSYVSGFAPLGALDSDPEQLGFFSPDIEGQIVLEPSSSNIVVMSFSAMADQLKGPYGTLQDLRPRLGGALDDAVCDVPAGDPFFDEVTFCGTLDASLFPVVPWYAPGPNIPLLAVPPAQPYGFLFVLVQTNQGAPIGGARVKGGGFLGVSDATGYALLYVPSGFIAYSLENLPMGCSDPGLFIINVPANGSAGQTATVQCT